MRIVIKMVPPDIGEADYLVEIDVFDKFTGDVDQYALGNEYFWPIEGTLDKFVTELVTEWLGE